MFARNDNPAGREVRPTAAAGWRGRNWLIGVVKAGIVKRKND
jgi:hypothetical protein